MFFVLVMCIFSYGVSISHAQIGNLGIYGSVPTTNRTNTRYVHIENADTASIGYTIPVNGLKNFNFYYIKEGTGFLPGGSYSVSYLDSSLSTLATEGVNYTPNSGHTNGTQVATAFNDPPSTPRGLHGVFYGRIGGVDYPFADAAVTVVGHYLQTEIHVRANATGYFDAYYQNGSANAFLPVDASHYYQEYYNVIVSGNLHGCTFATILPLDFGAYWSPYNTTNPSASSYFVTDAETDIGDWFLTPIQCVGD